MVTDAGHIRSSESSTETLGHWFDTVDRQRRNTDSFDYWLETVDRQRGILRRLVTALDTVDRLRVGSKMFGH